MQRETAITTSEAAKILETDVDFVERLIDSGRLTVVGFETSPFHLITRSSVLAHKTKRELDATKVGALINELIEAGVEY
jgi:hypothetical protein